MKLPHFFIYAKDKEKIQVSSINMSTVNKLNDIIPNKPIQFKQLVGEVNYKHLKKVKSRKVDEKLIEKFTQINKQKHFNLNLDDSDEGFERLLKNELSVFSKDEDYIVDVLVEYLFNTDSAYKSTLWDVYGERLYKNLKKSLGNTIQCDNCNVRFESKTNKVYCEECSTEKLKESRRKASKKYKQT
jgi:hypothetical protein